METMMLNEINEYWSNRVSGYSQVNQEELNGMQRTSWKKVICGQIEKHYPGHLPRKIKILDIGTGPGFLAIILAEEGYQVTAVDYNTCMLEEAGHNAGKLRDHIEFMQMDGQNLTFEKECFDVVLSRNLTWVLEQPLAAYQSWKNVLRTGGLLLNFDANWYGYLYDDNKKKEFEQDRECVKALGIDDHYLGTDVDSMEAIARNVPLSKMKRPDWDKEQLQNISMKVTELDNEVWKKVWSDVEQINYASTPMFMVAAQKL